MLEFDSFGRYKPLYVDGSLVYAYKSHKLYLCNYLSGKVFTEICTLPMKPILRTLTHFRVFERLFRTEPRAAYLSIEKKLSLSYCGSIYEIGINNNSLKKVHTFRKGMNNPLSFCEIKNIKGFDDCLAYGEYWGNIKREPVAIYTNNLISSAWEKVFEFPENSILHIHSIVPDKYNNRVLILTGDKDNESGFWIASENFTKVEPLIVGQQSYRSCAAFPTIKGILFATDTPLEDNYIGLIEESDKGFKINRLFPMEGPCINYSMISSWYCFATSVEPDSNIKGIKYYLTNKRGKGVKSNYCTLIIGNLEDGFKEITRIKKDILPTALFQFGNICFPASVGTDQLIIYPQSVDIHDGKMLIANLNQLR